MCSNASALSVRALTVTAQTATASEAIGIKTTTLTTAHTYGRIKNSNTSSRKRNSGSQKAQQHHPCTATLSTPVITNSTSPSATTSKATTLSVTAATGIPTDQ